MTTTIPKKVEEEDDDDQEEAVRFSILSSSMSFLLSLSLFLVDDDDFENVTRSASRSPACSRVGETKRERERKKEIKRWRRKDRRRSRSSRSFLCVCALSVEAVDVLTLPEWVFFFSLSCVQVVFIDRQIRFLETLVLGRCLRGKEKDKEKALDKKAEDDLQKAIDDVSEGLKLQKKKWWEL